MGNPIQYGGRQIKKTDQIDWIYRLCTVFWIHLGLGDKCSRISKHYEKRGSRYKIHGMELRRDTMTFYKKVVENGSGKKSLRFWVILGCQVQNDLKTLGNRFLGRDLNFLKKCQKMDPEKIVYASGTFWDVRCRMTWKRVGTGFWAEIWTFWKMSKNGSGSRGIL